MNYDGLWGGSRRYSTLDMPTLRHQHQDFDKPDDDDYVEELLP